MVVVLSHLLLQVHFTQCQSQLHMAASSATSAPVTTVAAHSTFSSTYSSSLWMA